MRIRTIKPEFWSHRKTGRLSLAGKCLAVGLLNLADDEGYFEADPILIRSSLFPFSEDSLSIHGALNELSDICYIEVRKNDEQGIMVGRVLNFLEHQVINRPSSSKLKAYYDSGSPHGVFTEPSHLARALRKGTGNRERKGKETPLQSPQGDGSQDNFEQFWAELPDQNRIAKGRTREAWKKAIKNGATAEQIIGGLDSYRRYERKRRKQDDYKPLHPTTWLNQGRFEDDEVVEQQDNGSDENWVNQSIYG